MSGAGLVGVLIVGCYLVGGIPFGFLVGRLHGLDIRKAGSGNIGATNVGRLLGRKWGILVFVLDVCKGLLPTLGLGQFLPGAEGLAGWSPAVVNTAWLAGGVACILGHNFPIYLRFRGGKGVATSLGVVLGVYPYLTVSGLCAFGVWVVVTLDIAVRVGGFDLCRGGVSDLLPGVAGIAARAGLVGQPADCGIRGADERAGDLSASGEHQAVAGGDGIQNRVTSEFIISGPISRAASASGKACEAWPVA
jgi:acyl-phosphate glycerol 3-phosphate acyltransferase